MSSRTSFLCVAILPVLVTAVYANLQVRAAGQRPPEVRSQPSLTEPGTIFVDVTNRSDQQIDALDLVVRFLVAGAAAPQTQANRMDFYPSVGLQPPFGEGSIQSRETRRFTFSLGSNLGRVLETSAEAVIYRDGTTYGSAAAISWFVDRREAAAKELDLLIDLLTAASATTPIEARRLLRDGLDARRRVLPRPLLNPLTADDMYRQIEEVLEKPDAELQAAVWRTKESLSIRRSNARRPIKRDGRPR
jgi:hypothetical protein